MIQDKNFDQELLDKIKDKKIEPKPKWQFLLKDYIIWVAGFISLLIGAIAVSLVIHMIFSDDLNIYRRFGKVQPLEFLLLSVPFFWLLCLLIFIALVYYDIKHTKKGYRYSAPIILVITIIASIVLGTGFYYFGFGQKIDDILGQRAPFYDRIINPHIRFWSNPEGGRLSGLVVAQTPESKIILVDEGGKEWSVSLEDTKRDVKPDIKNGKPMRFLGQKTSDYEFKALEILPVNVGRGYFKRFKTRFPKQEGMNRGRMPREGRDEFLNLLEKYPELKKIFAQTLIDHKDEINKIISNNPDAVKYFGELEQAK